MRDKPPSRIVAIGTWLYGGHAVREIQLVARPAKWAAARWIEDDSGDFIINESAPVPQTPDGHVYYVGVTSGGEFPTAEEAMAWADKEPWGPVTWRTLPQPIEVRRRS